MSIRIVRIILLLVLIPCWTNAQLQLALGRIEQHKVDSMRRAIKDAPADSIRFQIINTLGSFYLHKNKDSALMYMQWAEELSRKNEKYLAEAASLMKLQSLYRSMGDLTSSYRALARAFEITEDPASERTHFIYPPGGNFLKQRLEILTILHGGGFGDLFVHTRNYKQSIHHYRQGVKIISEINYFTVLPQFYLHMTWAYSGMEMPDSALYYAELAEKTAKERNLMYHIEVVYNGKADILFDKGRIPEAMNSYHEAMHVSQGSNTEVLIGAYLGLANCHLSLGGKDSSLYYSRKALEKTRSLGHLSEAKHYRIYERLYQSYLLNNKQDSAFKYLAIAKKAKDQNNDDYIKSLAEFQRQFIDDRVRLVELEKEKIEERSTTRTYLLLGGIGLLLVLTAFFYYSIQQKQRANEIITRSYGELRDTQQQLIQREKMASLGELTAGIAHEIQNPLNFVNNFSEVNKELLVEMKEELINGNVDGASSIADNVIENEEKINHHGRRADAIVKGMLQHSRSSSGQKELTDINALCDEYLRLAYHGLRAKDKSFSSGFETDFQSTLPKVNVVPQEMGRVILNLINNAFYAVNEKRKVVGDTYEPIVKVSTARNDRMIEIMVKDNGNGIPASARAKIFQPFFTTKPVGQGTGLGLSLSYDIVRAHGGEIKMETQEGGGASFTIHLVL